MSERLGQVDRHPKQTGAALQVVLDDAGQCSVAADPHTAPLASFSASIDGGIVSCGSGGDQVSRKAIALVGVENGEALEERDGGPISGRAGSPGSASPGVNRLA